MVFGECGAVIIDVFVIVIYMMVLWNYRTDIEQLVQVLLTLFTGT